MSNLQVTDFLHKITILNFLGRCRNHGSSSLHPVKVLFTHCYNLTQVMWIECFLKSRWNKKRIDVVYGLLITRSYQLFKELIYSIFKGKAKMSFLYIYQ